MYEVKVELPDEKTWDELCLLARRAGARSPADQIARMVISGLATAEAELGKSPDGAPEGVPV